MLLRENEVICGKCGKEYDDTTDNAWASGGICPKCRKKADTSQLYDEEYRIKGSKDLKKRKARKDRGRKRKPSSWLKKPVLFHR